MKHLSDKYTKNSQKSTIRQPTNIQAKDMNSQLTKADRQISNKHMKKYSTSPHQGTGNSNNNEIPLHTDQNG